MNKKKILITISLFLLLTSLFYWFGWKPSEIRKSCANKIASLNKGLITINNTYRECLVKNGLKPESIYVDLDTYYK